MLNLIQHLTKSTTYETLKQVQGDRLGLFTSSSYIVIFYQKKLPIQFSSVHYKSTSKTDNNFTCLDKMSFAGKHDLNLSPLLLFHLVLKGQTVMKLNLFIPTPGIFFASLITLKLYPRLSEGKERGSIKIDGQRTEQKETCFPTCRR